MVLAGVKVALRGVQHRVKPHSGTPPKPPLSAPVLLDVESAALYLSVTVPFMRRLVNERRIAFHKVGRYVRFKPEDLNAFVESGRVEARS